MDSSTRGIALRELINHTSGLSNGPFSAKSQIQELNPSEARRHFAKIILGAPKVGMVGEKSSYAPGVEIVGVAHENYLGDNTVYVG